MPAETTYGDGEINAPADRDSVGERLFETCLVDHAVRIIDPQAESGGLSPHTQQGTEEIGRDKAAGRSDEGKVPERVDAGTALERRPGSDIHHVDLAEQQGNRFAKVLRKINARQVKGVGALHPWKNERRIGRDQRTPSPVDTLTIIIFGVDG